MSLSVVVADDQPLVRAGLQMIIDATDDLTVVAEASNGTEAVDHALRLRPDVVIMDVRMPKMDGLEATRLITSSGDQAPRVLILTTFDLDEYVYAALRAGASGFLLKDLPPEELVAGIRTVASGDALLAPAVTTRLIASFLDNQPRRAAPPSIDTLTARELEILKLIAKGLSNAEIAQELFLAIATVRTHVTRILSKLNLRDRVQAVVLAYETAIVRPGPGPEEPASR
jgi:DNA-binding NarL/FixJ family response regulator